MLDKWIERMATQRSSVRAAPSTVRRHAIFLRILNLPVPLTRSDWHDRTSG
jgi:hypothetical protein